MLGLRTQRKVEGRYTVDEEGVVYSDGLPLTPVAGTWVRIYGERRYVSYLVARAWVPNPEGRPYVRHINGDMRDNRASNLEWSEEKEEGGRRGPKPMSRQVVQYDRDGNRVGVYPDVPSAAKAVGSSPALIRAALKRKGKTGGYLWMWL